MPRRNSICGHEVAKYNQKSGAMQIYFGGAESTDHEVQIRNHNQGGRQGDSNQDQLLIVDIFRVQTFDFPKVD